MIKVYVGTDTAEVFNVTQAGAAFDLDAKSITRVDVEACSALTALVDTTQMRISSTSGDITWLADVLTIKLGKLQVLPGRYVAKVTFYDAANPLGFVVDELVLQVSC